MNKNDPIIDIIVDYIGAANFVKGRYYYPYYITYKGVKNERHYFEVDSESRRDISYKVELEVEGTKIVSSYCNCPQYDIEGCCKHIATCLYNYKDSIFNLSEDERTKMISKSIIEKFYSEPEATKVGLKKQAHLAVEVYFSGCGMSVFLKVGEDKLYSATSKMSAFINAYRNKGVVSFGKQFTYDANVHFFSKDDEQILKFLIEYDKRIYSTIRDIYLTDEGIDEFFDVMKGKSFTFHLKNHSGIVREVKDESPISLVLSRSHGQYTLHASIGVEERDFLVLTRDWQYVYKDETIYKLSEDMSSILCQMDQNGIADLIFEDGYFQRFMNSILPIVKEHVTLDESVKDKVIIGIKPQAKVYLDMTDDLIVGNVKFLYGSEEIDFFSENVKISRDKKCEEGTVSEVLKYGFKCGENAIYMDEMDRIGEFLESGLESLASDFEVFSSNKIKSTNILKDNKVRSTFSIGRDNIMRYGFDFGNIKEDEVVDILESLKAKKKYYRLKSGDFLNLYENEDLQELDELMDDLDFQEDDLMNGGEIPKYRAIYLAGLKKERYHIIETNNLFDELIQKFNSYKDSEVKFSKKDSAILRDYQQTGVKWLYNIYKCGFGGILADEMGLGKSIQLIYFIKEILKEKNDAKILIVAPTSLIYNWKNEFDKFGSELEYKVIAENKEIRKQELEHLEDKNVIITTYGLLRRDKEIYNDICFELVAIDEAQNIKNANAQMTKAVKSLKATTKIALTGTPLENSVLELWSIFDFIMPGYLTNLTNFQRRYNIKDFKDDDMAVLNRLKSQIDPFILRRRKKDVIKELPDKIENNIYIDLSDEQKKLYVAQLEKTQKELDEIIAKEGFQKGNFKILQLLLKLRQLCIDPTLIYEDYHGGSTKIENLVSITKDIIKNGHKILLFTSFKMALDLVNKEFTNNNISTYVIDGSVPSKKRMELVDKFNSDDTNVFLITLKSGGTGLNLTSADVVIHLDLWWNPQVENQATDRAHRIGQKNTVEVIKLICRGTIEERILELQNKKKLLSDNLIEGENRDHNVLSKLSEKDIRGLLAMDNEEE